MNLPRAAAVSPLALLLLTSPAWSDVLTMKDGREIEAVDVQDRSDGTIEALTLQGARTFRTEDVKARKVSVDAAADVRLFVEAFAKKRDTGALMRIAQWAGSSGLALERRRTLERIVAISPDHAGAREALGQEKRDGKWVDRADAGLPEDERHRAQRAAHYERFMQAKPEIVLTAHFEGVDFLGDGGASSRLKDLESAFAEAERMFGEAPWKDRCVVVSCEGKEQYEKWIHGEAGSLRGMTPTYREFLLQATGIKWHEPKFLGRWNSPSIGSMHAANVHAAGHLLLNLWRTHNRKAPFWIEEGFGAWMEDRILGTYSSYCFDLPTKTAYGDTAKDAKDWDAAQPDFKALSKKAAESGTFLPLASLDVLPRGQYSRREVGQSISLVAFLLEVEGSAKFRDYCGRVKSGTVSAKAFEAVYGVTFDGIEPRWKRFVQDGW